jgi:prevent-host-death family protein
MEHFVSVSEANQRFSSLLKKVKQGDKVIITSRGTEVAELSARQKKRPTQAEIDAYFEFAKSIPRRTFNWTREDAYD